MKIIITKNQYKSLMEEYVPFPLDYDIRLEVWEDDKKLELETLIIPKVLRGFGKGTEIMNMVIDYSEKVGKPIFLTPDTSYGGTSISRLKKFYTKFGFVRNKDLSVKQMMVRYPKNIYT